MFKFSDFDKVLIGIGESFDTKFPENIKNQWDELRFLKENDDSNIMDAYNSLARMLEGVDYYVVSTCTDDRIYSSELSTERIVTPCGGYRYLQCPDNCSNALLPYEREMLKVKDTILCPKCNKAVVFNKMPMDHYNEGGYIEKWQDYNKWLQSTINKKLLVIELGVGMKYPTVIRFAFEKTIFYNQKSIMYRIHDTLAFATPEVKERCICIAEDPVEYLLKM